MNEKAVYICHLGGNVHADKVETAFSPRLNSSYSFLPHCLLRVYRPVWNNNLHKSIRRKTINIMEKLGEIRNQFTQRRGGKLIAIESIVLGIIIFGIAAAEDNMAILALALLVVFAFIMLFTSNFWPVSLIGGAVVFYVNFRIHKTYANLDFKGNGPREASGIYRGL